LLAIWSWLGAQDAPRRITVLSYNIHHGEGTDGRVDLERIAGVIRAQSPDLVALQEVDRGARRTGGVNQAQGLACLLGMDHLFGRTIDYEGGMYGNAVLTRLPVKGFVNRALPFTAGREPRGVLQVEVYTGPTESGHFLFRVFATHLDITEADRLKAVEALSNWVAEDPDVPTLLLGDLNALPGSAPLSGLVSSGWHIAGRPGAYSTFPAREPQRQIDYILFRPAHRWRVLEVWVPEEAVASDHRPIAARLELLPPEDGRWQDQAPPFSSSSRTTASERAARLCGSCGGIQTQAPAWASRRSSPSLSSTQPWSTWTTAAVEAVCSESSSPGAKPNSTTFSRSSL